MARAEHIPINSREACYHCGLEALPEFSATVNNQPRAFCCIGCQAVAQAIEEGGLVDFYRYRDKQNPKPEIGTERFEAYDLEEVQTSFVREHPDCERRPRKQVRLLIGGISCAACAWLIEHYLERIEGASRIRVNVASHICVFDWNPEQVTLSRVFSALHRIGYRPQPGTELHTQKLRKAERRSALLRIGIAGLGMMQVGMVGIALHAGAIQGIDANWQHFLRWVSLIFAIPVICFSAQPFFVSAYRSISMRRLNMDVPVSLALILAFAASLVATFYNTGEVYYDSVSMFTFFLLVGRYLEMRARHISVFETERLSQLLPVSAERYTSPNGDPMDQPGKKHRGESESVELVPLGFVQPGDSIRVTAGDVIPCDGVLVSSLAMSDESLLTGEAEPVRKKYGDTLYAGAMLAEPSIKLRVSATAADTRLASVQALLDQAISNKPKQQQLADRVASHFVAAVLLCFVGVFSAWYVIDPTKAFWVALSVLVVTCPCALSLATPAALAAGLNALRRSGLLIVAPSTLETLPHIDHIALDKTGTLTLGEPRLVEVKTLVKTDPLAKKFLIECVAALEKFSRHPIANAFKETPTLLTAESIEIVPGMGIEGVIQQRRFRFGVAQYAVPGFDGHYPASGNWQLLSRDGVAVAWFLFGDEPRYQLEEHLSAMQRNVSRLSLLSGDRQENVDGFVEKHGLQHLFKSVKGAMLPRDKLEYVRRLQERGEKVLMVGDGINDVPVLAASDLSVAMGSASQLAKVNADAVLLNQNLARLSDAVNTSRRVGRVIKQNFAWALGYNLLALPAAALGYVPPYMAAIGMSLSSLIVVLNSLRVSRQTNVNKA